MKTPHLRHSRSWIDRHFIEVLLASAMMLGLVVAMTGCNRVKRMSDEMFNRPQPAQRAADIRQEIEGIESQIKVIDTLAKNGPFQELVSTHWQPIILAIETVKHHLTSIMRQIDRLENEQSAVVAMRGRIVQLESDEAARWTKIWYGASFVGLIIFAGGVAGILFIPIPGLKWIGGFAAVLGGVICIGAAVMAVAMPGLSKVMPWVIGSAGVLAVIVGGVGVFVLIRRMLDNYKTNRVLVQAVEQSDYGNLVKQKVTEITGDTKLGNIVKRTVTDIKTNMPVKITQR